MDDAQAPAAQPRPGWYPDPWVAGQHRYWDGAAWTAHSFPTGTGPVYGTNAGGAAPWVAPTDMPPPPPAWDAPVQWDPPPPPPPPPTPPPTGGWRMPTGVAFAAVLLAVGLIVGFLATISTYYALGGRTKNAAEVSPTTTPPVAPFSPFTPFSPFSPGTTAPSSPVPTVPGGGTPAAPGGGVPGGAGASCAATPPTTAPGTSSLSGLVVSQADVPSTVVVQPLQCGNQVTGETTLDLCNGTYPSESLRTARRQVMAVGDVGLALSTEAVLYTNAAATAQAFSELKSVAAKCPSTPVVSPVGSGTLTTHFGAPPDGAWPQVAGVERLAYEFDSTDDTGQTSHSIAVYLRRGRVLMGVYFAEPAAQQLTVQDQSSTAAIVNVFAQRMAQLPASVVNG